MTTLLICGVIVGGVFAVAKLWYEPWLQAKQDEAAGEVVETIERVKCPTCGRKYNRKVG